MGKKKRKKKTLRLIGRRDRIDIPELELIAVEAKVDTGAYTSALHVQKIRAFKRDGVTWVRFRLRHPSNPLYSDKVHEFPVVDEKTVRNSFGKIEERYTIRTPIRLFGKSYKVEFSLTNRAKLECPVLLGRKVLYRRFVVDVSQKDLSYQQKLKQTVQG
ncbi:MAG: RimK/LysX family protein [Bacteroidota bacterium]